MTTGELQAEDSQRFTFMEDLERLFGPGMGFVGPCAPLRDLIGIGLQEAITRHATTGLTGNPIDARAIATGHEHALSRDAPDKLDECLFIRGRRREEVRMVPINTGQDDPVGFVVLEFVLIFIRFEDEVSATPSECIARPLQYPAPDDRERIEVRFAQYLGQERTRRRLAMRAGYRERPVLGRQFPDGLRIAEHRLPAGQRGCHLLAARLIIPETDGLMKEQILAEVGFIEDDRSAAPRHIVGIHALVAVRTGPVWDEDKRRPPDRRYLHDLTDTRATDHDVRHREYVAHPLGIKERYDGIILLPWFHSILREQ